MSIKKQGGRVTQVYAVDEPPFLPIGGLHRATIEHSHLDPAELSRVYYDSPHHWIVTFWMLFNPFWGRDNDIQFSISETIQNRINSRVDSAALNVLRGIFGICQILWIALLVFGVTGFVVVHGQRPVSWSLLIMAFLSLVAWVLVLLWWVSYVKSTAQGYRLVLTSDGFCNIIHQLPWRDETRIAVRWSQFNFAVINQTIVGKLLGYADVLVYTKENDEPAPAFIRMPLKNLKDIFAHVQQRNKVKAPITRVQSGPADATGQKAPREGSGRQDEPEITQQIPVTETATAE